MNKILEPKSAFSIPSVSRTDFNWYCNKQKKKTLDLIRPLSTDLIPSRYFISYLLIKVSVKAQEHEACALVFLRARLSPEIEEGY